MKYLINVNALILITHHTIKFVVLMFLGFWSLLNTDNASLIKPLLRVSQPSPSWPFFTTTASWCWGYLCLWLQHLQLKCLISSMGHDEESCYPGTSNQVHWSLSLSLPHWNPWQANISFFSYKMKELSEVFFHRFLITQVIYNYIFPVNAYNITGNNTSHMNPSKPLKHLYYMSTCMYLSIKNSIVHLYI